MANSLAYSSMIYWIGKSRPTNAAAWIFYGANPNGEFSYQAGEPLRVALVSKSCFDMLLTKGANPSINGNKPIQDAADRLRGWAVKKLVEKGANINANGYYVLLKFGIAGKIKMVKWIMTHGGIVSYSVYNSIRNAGKTAVAGYLRSFL